jgi:hypothetical protein
MKPVAEIIETLVRYECPKCGDGCRCGVPYIPKTMRAREAIEANPEKSDRAIATELGVRPMTVGRARATVPDVTVDERTGLDGKVRKVPARRTDSQEAELRGRAETLGYKMRRRGDVYEFHDKDGAGAGAEGIENASNVLDIIEGKVAVEYTTACGRPTGANNAKAVAAYNAKHATEPMEDSTQNAARVTSAEDVTEDEDTGAFLVAVTKNATDKANIVVRNLGHEFSNHDENSRGNRCPY